MLQRYYDSTAETSHTPDPDSAEAELAGSGDDGGVVLFQRGTGPSDNAANQLTSVQLIRDGNTQTRSFTWSGMDLASATNPENGTVSYTYDGAHHVLTRTDAIGQVTQYGYDAYERLTSVAYPGSATPGVTYYYDSYGQSTNTWGRLAAVAFGGGCVANGSANAGYLYTYGYNPAGRVTAQGMQVTLNQSYPSDGDQCSSLTVNQSASYSWDNEGRMTSLLYPGSTNNVTYTYDSMGHQNGLTDSVTGTTASATYGTAGEMDSLSYNLSGYAGTNESFTYNNLWQLTGISATVYPATTPVMNMQYVYPAGHNNGRISQSVDGVLGQTVNYGYDSLNRLSTAQATNGSWGQSYSYDGFGNLTAKTVTAGSAINFSASYNTANQMTNFPQGYTGYDANGNTLEVVIGSSWVQYTYDVENRITSNGYSIYGYDPQNKRVMVQTGTGSSPIIYSSLFTFYSVTGQRLSTFTITSSPYTGGSEGCPNQAESICASGPTLGYLYLAGKRLMVADRLGSQRGNGQAYYPWGEPMNSPAPTGDVEFATYWRDMVGQNYADQRYYNSNAGRFYTPDPAGKAVVSLGNPASWNMYAYTNDDPINRNDPTGLCPPGYVPATTAAQDQAIVSTAESYVEQGLQHSSGVHFATNSSGSLTAIDCTGLLMQALAGIAYTSGVFQPASIANITTGNLPSMFSPTSTFQVGDIVVPIPGHAVIVTAVNAQGQITSFVGSQSSTGPAIVSTSSSSWAYWGPKIAAAENAGQVYRPCVPAGTQASVPSSSYVAATQQASSWWQNVSNYMPGLAEAFLEWVDSIPVGGDPYEVDSTIAYQ